MKAKSRIFVSLFSLLLLLRVATGFAIQRQGLSDQSVDSLLQWVKENSTELEGDTLFRYSRLALTKAQLLDDPMRIGDAYASLAKLHRSFSYSYDSILHNAEKAVFSYREAGDQVKMADGYLNMSYSFSNKLSFLSAEESAIAAIAIYEEFEMPSQLAVAYGLLSYMHFLSGAYEDAVEYVKQSYLVAKSIQDTLIVIEALTYTIPIYVKMDQNSIALSTANEGLGWLNSFGKRTSLQEMDLYYYRGGAYVGLNKLEEAWDDYNKAWKMAKDKWKFGESEAIFYTDGIAYIQQLRGDYKAAIETNKRLIEYLYRTGEFENLIETHQRLGQCYEELGDYKEALTQNRLAWQLEDSIKTLRSNKLASELQIRYETAKREETISNQQTQIDRQQRIQNLSAGIAVLSLLLFSGLFYSYRHNKRRNQELQLLNQSLLEKNSLLDHRNAQNETLLKEIHHRVKNNLEIVSSLLELQSAQLHDVDQQKALQSSQGRIQSMSIVHQKLYHEDNLSTIEMRDYFKNLSEYILDSYAAHDCVAVECNMDPIALDLDTAIPIGLIVNELLTNALKHAFPNGKKGRIEITLKEISSDYLFLVVADNGIGKSETTSLEADGFGSQLISLLTKQLKGTVQEDVTKGTKVSFELKKASSEV